MEISLRTAFPSTYAEDALANPLNVCALAAAGVESTYDDQSRLLLKGLNEFSAPSLLVRNAFSAERISVPTPDRMAATPFGAELAIAASLSVIAAAELVPIAYQCENDGQLCVNLVPQSANTSDRRGYTKSTSKLRGHTDGSFFPNHQEFAEGDTEYSCCPDFIALAGIRNPDRVATRIALLSDILPLLENRHITALEEPNFILTPQASFSLAPGSVRFGPVLWRDEHGIWCCRFSHSQIAADPTYSDIASEALRAFAAAAMKVTSDIVIEPGNILIFNNRLTVHGRGAIAAPWSPESRWLLRTYAKLSSTGVNPLPKCPEWLAA